MCGEFDLFVDRVGPRYQGHVSEIHSELMKRGYRLEMKTAKSGLVVSCIREDAEKTLATFVQRRSDIKLQVFADHIAEFQRLLNTFPRRMKTEIRKASVCKRLLDSDSYNPRCRMDYTFVMERGQYQKCHYMAFLLILNEEGYPYILQLLHKELDHVGSGSWGQESGLYYLSVNDRQGRVKRYL